MADLTIETAWVCDSNLRWERSVRSSDGRKTYTVAWKRLSERLQGCLYGWTCTCKHFEIRKTNCKHIDSVMHERCGWNEEMDPTTTPLRTLDTDPCCPDCGGPVTAMRVAV